MFTLEPRYVHTRAHKHTQIKIWFKKLTPRYMQMSFLNNDWLFWEFILGHILCWTLQIYYHLNHSPTGVMGFSKTRKPDCNKIQQLAAGYCGVRVWIQAATPRGTPVTSECHSHLTHTAAPLQPCFLFSLIIISKSRHYILVVKENHTK